MLTSRWLPVLAAIVLAISHPVAGQEVATGYDPHRVHVSRTDLQLMLQRLDQAAASSQYSKPVREKAAAEAALIRLRLSEGDFQVGDRIILAVEGEPTLTDTFTVVEPQVLNLPLVGDVSLRGVLRSELEPHMQANMAKFLRQPVVHARPLIRVSLAGQVVKPGFYVMPSNIVLSDALMMAGGPSPAANLKKLKILRNGEPIWEGDALQKQLTEGSTLDQLNLRAGDQVVVPRTSGSVVAKVAPVLLALTTTLWLIFDND